MATYQPGIPTGSVPLNQDFKNLKGNFTSLNDQWLVDHVPLTTAPGPSIGYHKVVHLVPFETNPVTAPPNYPVVAGVNGPAATAGFGQIFDITVNDGLSADQSLYFLSGGGLLTQLTRNLQPTWDSVNNRGYTFLPGGFIYQWGFTGSIPGGATVSFGKTFPGACFNVQVTARGSSPGGFIFVQNISTSNWQLGLTGGGNAQTYWTAIGN